MMTRVKETMPALATDAKQYLCARWSHLGRCDGVDVLKGGTIDAVLLSIESRLSHLYARKPDAILDCALLD